eukprot:CAMPEP_0194162342 /NCGR_PEP_ID=MMETSP0152-20130528/79444_1 /TAXON_ID=1049557 /ORGANISM="Thalassiothrix antarctica, Strain L6-D1" /LENGTH=404 /DNA_ID=CAMNT_0038872233 /DNA_START=442 /DNA_END=1656 /DNA_ORIENTATION=+
MTKSSKTKYKKAPQAPRRFKSAYIFFSTIKHKEIREELGTKGIAEKTTNIAKLVSKAWKELSTDERNKWEGMARQDKHRFEVEKSLYTGPWKMLAKKGSQKDPNAPKRPMSAFLAYSHAKRASVKVKNPGLNNAETSRLLARIWKEATEEDKREYIEQESQLRQKYLSEIAVWRENKEREIKEEHHYRGEFVLKRIAALESAQEQIKAQHSQHNNNSSEISRNLKHADYDTTSSSPYFDGSSAPPVSYGHDFRCTHSSYFPSASQHQPFDQSTARIWPHEALTNNTYAEQSVDYYHPSNYRYPLPVASAYPADYQQYLTSYGRSYGGYATQDPNFGRVGPHDHRPYTQSQGNYDPYHVHSNSYHQSHTKHDYQLPLYSNDGNSNNSKQAIAPTTASQEIPNYDS